MIVMQDIEIIDVDVAEAMRALEGKPDAQLIDVRTTAEWAFVGYPQLETIGKAVIFVEWQSFPDKANNAGFVPQVVAQLEARNVGMNAELYFICRTGVRSLHAAREMNSVGYLASFNVAKGFEGSQNDAHQRGLIDGWKAAGLPWKQG